MKNGSHKERERKEGEKKKWENSLILEAKMQSIQVMLFLSELDIPCLILEAHCQHLL